MPRPALPMPACDALCLLLLACTEMMDQYKTCASDIFYEFKVQNRPSVLPPHGINGGNAATGGQVKHFDESNFRGALPGADGEETYGEVDDDYDENAPPPKEPLAPLYESEGNCEPQHATIFAQDARGSDAVSAALGTIRVK